MTAKAHKKTKMKVETRRVYELWVDGVFCGAYDTKIAALTYARKKGWSH